jgi:hypothetical protein
MAKPYEESRGVSQARFLDYGKDAFARNDNTRQVGPSPNLAMAFAGPCGAIVGFTGNPQAEAERPRFGAGCPQTTGTVALSESDALSDRGRRGQPKGLSEYPQIPQITHIYDMRSATQQLSPRSFLRIRERP